MAQHDYNIANQSGQAFRADLNNALAAIVSNNSGASGPSTTYAHQIWFDTSTSPVTIRQRDASNAAWFIVGAIDALVQTFVVNGAERMRIDSSGRVGIGTTNASELLEIAAATDPKIRFVDVANIDAKIGIVGSTALGFEVNGSEWMRIGFTGNVSIGNSSPASRLDVSGAVTARGDGSLVGLYLASGLAIREQGSGSTLYVDVATGGASHGQLVFRSSSAYAETMRINADQELLIGYSADNGAYKLQVNSQIFATSATIATSDGRYKENIATLNGCFDLVKALRPISFTWKPQENITRLDADGNEVLVRECHNFPVGTQVGFIAQEVQEALDEKPWLGSIVKQNARAAVTDADGNELAPEEEFLGIAEGNLIAVLTSALQEAIAKIELLESKVAALESA